MYRNNNTRHFLFTFTTGEVITEKCRDTLGGYNNMLNRVAAAIGADSIRPVNLQQVQDHGSEGALFTGAGLTFTISEWSKL